MNCIFCAVNIILLTPGAIHRLSDFNQMSLKYFLNDNETFWKRKKHDAGLPNHFYYCPKECLITQRITKVLLKYPSYNTASLWSYLIFLGFHHSYTSKFLCYIIYFKITARVLSDITQIFDKVWHKGLFYKFKKPTSQHLWYFRW